MKTKTKGNENITVAGDIIINYAGEDNEFNLDKAFEVIESIFSVCDEMVGNKVPDGVLYKDGAIKEFNSSQLVRSLSALGIPITVSFYVLSEVVSFIVTNHDDPSIRTMTIANLVMDSLHNYKPKDTFKAEDVHSWIGKYVRRYALPEDQLLVIYPNGDMEVFSHNYVRKRLFPNLIQMINNKEGRIFYKSYSKKEIHAVRNELFDSIKSLNICRIHHDALLKICKELLLQPPHPIFVSHAFDHSFIVYNLSKIQRHEASLARVLEYDEIAKDFFYRAREVLHHACASILGYYKLLVGCGELSAAINLRYIVNKINKNDTAWLSMISEVEVLKNDLHAHNIDIEALFDSLDRTIKWLNGRAKEQVETCKIIANNIINILEVAKTLLYHHGILNDIEGENLRNMSTNDKMAILESILAMIPFSSIKKKDIGKNLFWVEVEKNPLPFAVQPRVLVMANDFPDQMKAIDNAVDLVNERGAFSNCFVIVNDQTVSEPARVKLRALRKSMGILGAIVSFEQALKIAKERDLRVAISDNF